MCDIIQSLPFTIDIQKWKQIWLSNQDNQGDSLESQQLEHPFTFDSHHISLTRLLFSQPSTSDSPFSILSSNTDSLANELNISSEKANELDLLTTMEPWQREDIRDVLLRVPTDSSFIHLKLLDKLDRSTQNDSRAAERVENSIRSRPTILERPNDQKDGSISDEPLPKEVIITFKLFRTISFATRQNCSQCELEVQVLGSQPLTVLRDLIACPNDCTVPGDLSDDPDARSRLPVASARYKGSFMFIDGVFYNDTRQPDAADCSSVVREWLEKHRGERLVDELYSRCPQVFPAPPAPPPPAPARPAVILAPEDPSITLMDLDAPAASASASASVSSAQLPAGFGSSSSSSSSGPSTGTAAAMGQTGGGRAGNKWECRAMQDTRFEQLRVRLGFPYVFVHSGQCEHTLVCADLRLLHPRDPPASAFPLVTGRAQVKRLVCRCCLRYTAWYDTYEVVGSPLLAEARAFLCDPCFRSLHYDAEGHKIVQFQAFAYIDRSKTCT